MHACNRRDWIRVSGVSVLSLAWPGMFRVSEKRHKDKKHLITLSFDDGFKKSSLLTAEIFEKYHLSACINVIATGHEKGFRSPDEYQVTEKGDFVLWNELQARGHEIMPHGYKHINMAGIPVEESQDLIRKCLDYFSTHLDGFDPARAVFNMPYNASTPELESWLSGQVRAFRTGGPGINSLPYTGQKKLTCSASGPGNTEEFLDREIETLLKLPSGWLIYNTHGLDGEGWGPMTSGYLDRLLGRLTAIESVSVIPTGKALFEVDR